VTRGKQEAVPIARLLGQDRQRVVGWVYLWNTDEVSILWIGDPRNAMAVDPPLDPNILAKAKSMEADAVTEYLEALARESEGDPD
jgi:hypothetical protein